jgi:hypothetical protein
MGVAWGLLAGFDDEIGFSIRSGIIRADGLNNFKEGGYVDA